MSARPSLQALLASAGPPGEPQASAVPETWDALVVALRAAEPGTWVRCLAWAVGGGDPDGLDIRVVGGRALYTNAWCEYGKREQDRDWVRLARLDPGPHEIVRWLAPEDLVEVRRADAGRELKE